MSSAKERLQALLAAKKNQTSAPEAPKVQDPTPPEIPEPPKTVVSTDCDHSLLPFKEKLMQLEEALNLDSPGFAYKLRDVHQAMAKQPDVVTILSEDEIALVVKGLSKMKGVVLGTETKSSGGRSRKTKVLTSDMI